MKGATLKIEPRNKIGGGKVKSLRRDGYIPSVIYGKDIDSIPVKIKFSDFRDSIVRFGKNAVFNIDLGENGTYPVVIRDIQYGIVKNDYLHIDFQQVSLTEKRQATVAVRILGRERIESTANIVNQLIDEIQVECLPQDTPDHVEVDVKDMDTGDTFTVEQLELPENVTLLSEPNDVIVKVSEARIYEEEIEEEEEEEGLEDEEAEETEESSEEEEREEK